MSEKLVSEKDTLKMIWDNISIPYKLVEDREKRIEYMLNTTVSIWLQQRFIKNPVLEPHCMRNETIRSLLGDIKK